MSIKLFIVDGAKITPYEVQLKDKIPGSKYLYVHEYIGSSKTNVLWIDVKLIKAFDFIRDKYGKAIPVKFGFNRIFEGKHADQSQHYVSALDCSQTSLGFDDTERATIRHLAAESGLFGYIEPESLTPDWVHFDVRKPGTQGYPNVSSGSIGTHVFLLQDCLNYLHYPCKLTGKMDDETNGALITFQRHYKLPVDGICGPVTWKKITSLI